MHILQQSTDFHGHEIYSWVASCFLAVVRALIQQRLGEQYFEALAC